MPKVPKREWGEFTDPESQEHAPTDAEMKEDADAEKGLWWEIEEIEAYLNPIYDFEEGKGDIFLDPQIVRDDIEKIRAQISSVKDSDVKKQFEKRVEEIERQIYKQYLPFVDSKVRLYGWQHSPMEAGTPEKKMNVEDVMGFFNEARAVAQKERLSEEEEEKFFSHLSRLQEKFERYQKEPILFTFETLSEELGRELFYVEVNDVLPEKKFLAKIQQLEDIVQKMSDEDTKKACEEVVTGWRKYLKYLKERIEEFATGRRGVDPEQDQNIHWARGILGISEGAKREEIKKAYHRAALRYHPDLNQGGDALEKMKEINKAMAILRRTERGDEENEM